MKSDAARSVILRQTFLLLLEKGYDGVSITDIQKATGLSRGLLYHYFENKETLFLEVVRKYFVDLYVTECDTKNFDLPQMIETSIRMHERLCSVALSDRRANMRDYDALFYRMMQENETFAQQWEDIRHKELSDWRLAVECSSNKGQLKDGLDLDMTARSFVFLMDGLWMQAIHNMMPRILITDLRRVLTGYYELLVR